MQRVWWARLRRLVWLLWRKWMWQPVLRRMRLRLRSAVRLRQRMLRQWILRRWLLWRWLLWRLRLRTRVRLQQQRV
jgi:hypothetical protein